MHKSSIIEGSSSNPMEGAIQSAIDHIKNSNGQLRGDVLFDLAIGWWLPASLSSYNERALQHSNDPVGHALKIIWRKIGGDFDTMIEQVASSLGGYSAQQFRL